MAFNKFRSKKARIMYFTLIAIFTIIFIAFFFSFEGQLFAKQKEMSMLNRCRNSVMLHPLKENSQFQEVIGHQTPLEKSGKGLDCPIIYKKVKQYGKDAHYINKMAADQMAGCWYKFGEGKVNLFSKKKGETTNFCAVCSVLSFKGEAKNKEVLGLVTLLANEEAPKLFGGQKYVDYLANVVTNEEMRQDIINQDLSSINTANDYLVLFFFPKKGYTSELEATGIGAKVGFGVGSGVSAALYFVPKGWIVKTIIRTVGGPTITVGASALGGWIGSFFGHKTGSEYGAEVLLMPYDEEALTALDCELPVPLGYRPS